MMARYGVKDSPAGFPPLPQAGRRSFCNAFRKRLPSIFWKGRKESLQAVVVVDVGLRTEDRAPWRGWFPETTPMAGMARDRFVASNPYAEIGIVPRELPARNTPGGSLQDVPSEQQAF
jgi:hypothetical protein